MYVHICVLIYTYIGSPFMVIMVFIASAALQGNPFSAIQRIHDIGRFYIYIYVCIHAYICEYG
jgi:hypothetical protein